MPFDPLSWALGFGLSKTATWLLDKNFSPDLQGNLIREASAWSGSLPESLWLDVATLFAPCSESDALPTESRDRLHASLRDERIPSLADWHQALMDQWRMIRARHPAEHAQPFFAATEDVVLPHLSELATRLRRVCQHDEDTFKGNTSQILDELLKRVSEEKGIGLGPLREILRKLGEENVPVDRIVERLEARADEYLQLLERLASAPNAATLTLLQEGRIDAARRSFRATDILRAKRNGEALSREDIESFIDGVTTGQWPDYQTSALLMAIVLRGMTSQETAWLTDALVRSGGRLDFSDVPGPRVTLKSTGAVGDKVEILVPCIVAACGVSVPNVSGRGLSYLGGTLDKLEAIPRLSIRLQPSEYQSVLRDAGCCFAAQSEGLVPADRRLFALRDVTGSVESIPLIVASMMSKAIAAGDGAFVIDIKYGPGCLFKQRCSADAFATEVVKVAKELSIAADVELSEFRQPVGSAIGNSLEIIECVKTLSGEGPLDVRRQAMSLAARMLCVAGKCRTRDEGVALATEALDSGAALRVFRRMVAAQGGDAGFVDDLDRLPRAPGRFSVLARQSGHVTAVDAQLLGLTALMLGSGRERIGDAIDHGVGVVLHRKIGDYVQAGDPFAEVHYRHERHLEGALAYVDSAFTIQADSRSEDQTTSTQAGRPRNP